MILDNKFYKIDSLTLMAGAPIVVSEYSTTIRQPKISDIAIIGEQKFFRILSIFQLEKKFFLESAIKNKSPQEIIQITNFFYDKTIEEIIFLILNNDIELQDLINNLFTIIFYNSKEILYLENEIIILFESGHKTIINLDNFYIIKDIINQIFSFNEGSEKYNPAAGAAEIIFKKLQERNRKIQQMKSESQNESKNVLANYLLILSIGSNNFSMNDLLNMTLYQLFAVMKKYSLYEQYQMQIKAMVAGASDIELIDWMEQN